MHKKSLSLALLLCSYAHADILQSSIVETKQGPDLAVRIEKGSVLRSLDKNKTNTLSVTVNNIVESKTDSIVEIEVDGRVIYAPHDQTFFDPVQNKWLKARNVNAKSHLLGSDMQPIPVLGSVHRKGEFDTVRISVDGSSYFFSDGVLTHNFWGVLARVGIFIASAVATSVIDNKVQGKIDSGSKDASAGKQQTNDHSTGDRHVHHHHHHHFHKSKSEPGK